MVSALDLEPIYCSEQIVVPSDLADILKTFAKEAIRRQPEDILEFSAIYFANLANVSGPADDAVPPTIKQLTEVWGMVSGGEKVTLEDFVSMCDSAGISSGAVDVMLRVGELSALEMVDPKEPLALLLAMTDSNLLTIVGSMFEVFGKEGSVLEAGEFLELFDLLTNKDSNITPALKESLKEAVSAIGDRPLSFSDVSDLPALAELI
mmetsp:Transcript_30998/g.101046  ORF Transcript_30998/g.101046 Transcript_30998/m.101046 type:complete len:207 (+) Transcript_30998:115-735(+)